MREIAGKGRKSPRLRAPPRAVADADARGISLFIYFFSHLVGSIEKTNAVTQSEGVDIVGQAALGELVGLHGFQAHDGLGHDAAVPVAAVTLFP